MTELNDYSGPFKPELRFEDFSKEFLLRLMNVWQFAWLSMSGAWFDAVKKRFGSDAANDCRLEAWVRVCERVHPRYPKVAHFQPTTVREAIKCFQLGPDNTVGGLFLGEYEFKNDNHVIMTITQCRSLLYFEREAPEMIYPTCHVLEKAVMEKQLLNPRIKVMALTLPPRKSRDEIACRWELRLEEEE